MTRLFLQYDALWVGLSVVLLNPDGHEQLWKELTLMAVVEIECFLSQPRDSLVFFVNNFF